MDNKTYPYYVSQTNYLKNEIPGCHSVYVRYALTEIG